MSRRWSAAIAAAVLLVCSSAMADDEDEPASTEVPQGSVSPRMAAAVDLMNATGGVQMTAYQMEFVANAYIEEYRQTHARASQEDMTLFAATLDDEVSKSVQDVAMTFAQSLVDHFSEDELLKLTTFARGDLYTRFTAALPQPVSGLGLFNILTVAEMGKDPKARRFADLYARFETPDDLQAMKSFIATDLGQRCVSELEKISREMTYTPGWLTKEVDRAKDRTISRLRLKGVHL